MVTKQNISIGFVISTNGPKRRDSGSILEEESTGCGGGLGTRLRKRGVS